MPEDLAGHDAGFGRDLRQAREAAGISLRALGLVIHYSKGHLSKIENGVVPASPELARACDKALSAGGRLVAAFVASRPRPEPPAAAVMAPVTADARFDVPPAPGHFTGRDAEAAWITAAILGSRDRGRAAVALIHGQPGVGKTALAIHVAHAVRDRFPRGCLFVDCGSGGTPAHARLLRRLGVPKTEIPDEPGEARALYLSVLDQRPVLIVADGVTTAGQVAALAPASSDCAVIATSRLRLAALDDCRALPLAPLGDDAGIALFRAVSGRDDPAATDDIRRIVVACGGLPLAIRIAAVRARHLGRDAAAMAALLDDPATTWAELDDGERAVQPALDGEVAALSRGARRALALIGLHPGQLVARQPAAWLVDDTPLASDASVAELAARHLVAVDAAGSARADGLPRAQLLAMAARLDERSRADALARLVTGYARAATAASRMLVPARFQPPTAGGGPLVPVPPFASRAEAIAWSQAEAGLVPRLCSLALELGLDEECWRLAYAMRDYFLAAGAVKPWIASHRVALLAARRSGDPWAEATTRNNLGVALAEGRQPLAAQEHHRLALDLLRGIGDEHGIAATLGHQAWAQHAAGRHAAAASLAEQARRLHRRHGNGRALAIMDRTAALALARSGRHREALALLAECQEILSDLDLPLDVAMTLNCLGEVRHAMGHHDRAPAFHRLAAEHAAACGGASEHARALRGLAAARQAGGAAAPAARQGAGARRAAAR